MFVASHLSHPKIRIDCPPGPGTLLSWDSEFISAAMKEGHVVPIWSTVLVDWCLWVKGETEREQVIARYPGAAVYTVRELEIMTRLRWGIEQLQACHETKKVFPGASIGESHLNPEIEVGAA